MVGSRSCFFSSCRSDGTAFCSSTQRDVYELRSTRLWMDWTAASWRSLLRTRVTAMMCWAIPPSTNSVWLESCSRTSFEMVRIMASSNGFLLRKESNALAPTLTVLDYNPRKRKKGHPRMQYIDSTNKFLGRNNKSDRR